MLDQRSTWPILRLIAWECSRNLACGLSTLQWRHNGHDGVSNYRNLKFLLNRLFRRRSKKTSKLHVAGPCEGNSPVTGEFPSQKTSNAENACLMTSSCKISDLNTELKPHKYGTILIFWHSYRLWEHHPWLSADETYDRCNYTNMWHMILSFCRTTEISVTPWKKYSYACLYLVG